MYYAYILQSRNGSYYIGSCMDIKKRLSLHNSGSVKSTKRYMPWNLVYSEIFDTLIDARKRELSIKKWKSRYAIEELIRRNKIS